MSELAHFNIIDHYRNLTKQLLARNAVVGTIFSHKDLLGNPAESIVRDFLRKFLPSSLRVETGQIVSPRGNRSPQSDVIVFHDMFGAIVGVSEAEEYLVRQEPVRCVLEVKRSIGGTTVKELQDHAKVLSTCFLAGGKGGPWIQWGVAFTADRSRDAILNNLIETYDPTFSIGALLVLDTEPTAEELKASARKHLNLTGSGQGSRRSVYPRVTGASVKRFISEMLEPRGAFFVRDKTHKYRLWEEVQPPLLGFATKLEETLMGSADVSNLSLKDFFPAIEAKECIARIRAGGGIVELDENQVAKPVVEITVDPGSAFSDVACSLRLFRNLKSLVLTGTTAADADLVNIANLKDLQKLSLASTAVTDSGIKFLVGLKALQEIDLTGTRVTRSGADELKMRVPGLQVRL
jgi:uncharacterized protein DUF6602